MYSVSVRHLTKIFRTDRGTVTATDDLSLTFPAGEITAVVGESGCGKTTLLRLIAGLETAYEGCVVTEATGNSAAPCETAVVFQEPRLFPWLSVADNLKLAVRQLPADEQDRRLADALSHGAHRSRRRLSDRVVWRHGAACRFCPRAHC